MHCKGKHVYAFGGERVQGNMADEEEDDAETLSEICQWDMETGVWVKLPVKGRQILPF